MNYNNILLYCFTHGERIDESYNGYFTGNCKYGSGSYGSHIVYLNPETNREEMGHPNSEFEKELGEIYSNTSFCIMSSLIPKGNNNYKIFSSIPHPMCYQINCSDTSLTIKINNDFIICPKEGGNIKVEGYDGFLHCPDYNLICTGTKVCNDIFDCIQQKSLYKETTFNYDYTPKTTQRFSQISSMPIIQENNYEISENGVCPLYCIQCDVNKKCKKCKDGYNMIGIKPEDNESVICDNTIDIKNIEYYSYENIYYKCNEECNGCTFANLCVSCKDNYYPLVDKNYCYKKEESISGYYFNQALKQFDSCHINCETCSAGPTSDEEMNCDSCKEGYEFDKNNKKCKNKSDTKISWIIILFLVLILITGIFLFVFFYFKKKNIPIHNQKNEKIRISKK